MLRLSVSDSSSSLLSTAEGNLRPPIGHHWFPFGMTFGRERSSPPQNMNQADAKKQLVYFIHRRMYRVLMPAGFKPTSSPITISQSLQESGANTFTEERVSLPLNTLDKEVFVVTALDADCNAPDMVQGTNTRMSVSVSTTSRTAIGNISHNEVIGYKALNIRSDATGAVAFESNFGETPSAIMDYIAIIATDDFFIQVEGVGNAAAKYGNIRLYGYRARVADAGLYAAMVQSELLS